MLGRVLLLPVNQKVCDPLQLVFDYAQLINPFTLLDRQATRHLPLHRFCHCVCPHISLSSKSCTDITHANNPQAPAHCLVRSVPHRKCNCRILRRHVPWTRLPCVNQRRCWHTSSLVACRSDWVHRSVWTSRECTLPVHDRYVLWTGMKWLMI